MSLNQSIPIPGAPWGLTYDPTNGQLFLGDSSNSSLAVVDTITNSIGSLVPLTPPVEDPIYDSGNGVVYVSDGTAALAEVNASNDTLSGSLNVSSDSEAYDPVNQSVYAVSLLRNWVTVIQNNTVTAQVVMTNDGPQGAVYDPVNHDVYVADYDGLAIIDAWSNTWVGNVSWNTSASGVSSSVVYDPVTEELFVATQGNQTRSSSILTVVSARNNSVAATLDVLGCCGQEAYDSQSNSVYVALDYAGTYGRQYNGVIGVINATTLTLAGQVPVGQDPQGVLVDPFNHEVYVAEAASYNLTLLFPLHLIEFNESGLPPGTTWSVRVNGLLLSSTTPTIAFAGANGLYNYSVCSIENYTTAEKYGSASVAGTNVSVGVEFSPWAYPVRFVEAGAPESANWSMRLGTQAAASVDGVVSYDEPNGTYQYIADPPSGYTTQHGTGSVYVDGHALGIVLNFSKNLTTSGSPRSWLDQLILVGVSVSAAAVLIVAAVWVVSRRRKRKSDPR